MTDAFTPQQTIELVSRTGAKKAHMRLDKLFINSCMAGPLLGFGCAVLVSVNASPWYQENAPGLIRMFGALLFPVGLVMIVISGADLFTTNIMVRGLKACLADDDYTSERDWLTLLVYIVYDYSLPHETSQLETGAHLLGGLLVSNVLDSFLFSKLILKKARKPRRHALLRDHYLRLRWCI